MDHRSQNRDNSDFFDGITEEDNPMPDWWLATFFGAIIFAGLYVIHYHVGSDDSLAKEYNTEKAVVEMARKSQALDPSEMEKLYLAAFSDPNQIQKGKVVFIEKCAACHGPEGAGLIGPNLTDKFWIHGKADFIDIGKVIGQGVLVKGMPAWDQVLSRDELIHVTAFVKQMVGKNLPGKAAEGNPID